MVVGGEEGRTQRAPLCVGFVLCFLLLGHISFFPTSLGGMSACLPGVAPPPCFVGAPRVFARAPCFFSSPPLFLTQTIIYSPQHGKRLDLGIPSAFSVTKDCFGGFCGARFRRHVPSSGGAPTGRCPPWTEWRLAVDRRAFDPFRSLFGRVPPVC